MAKTVLVCEDERKLRDVVRGYLEHDGLGVLTTGSGAEALRLAERGVDLLVLDLGLPDIPGEEVARGPDRQGSRFPRPCRTVWACGGAWISRRRRARPPRLRGPR